MTLALTKDECLQSNGRSSELDALLLEVIETKASLDLVVEDEAVSLSVGPTQPAVKQVELEIRHLPSDIFAPPLKVGARLLIPLLADIVRIRLPHHQIYSTRRHKRSAVDFFMRNLAHALCRNDSVAFHAVGLANSAPASSIHREIAKRYLWVLKTLIRDPLFESTEFLDHVYLNAHFPILTFQGKLLTTGANELRERLAPQKTQVYDVPVDLFQQFTDTRNQMMRHFNG